MTNSRQVAGFLVVLDSQEFTGKIPFFLGENIIGRSQTKATLVIKQVSISQKHAILVASAKKITLTDLGSKNGTKINNEDNIIEVQKQVQVDESMVIYFAEVKCKIEILKNREDQVHKTQINAREKEKRKQEVLKQIEKEDQAEAVKNNKENKRPKDEFKKIPFISDVDLNEDFVADIKKEEKVEKIQKQAKKKNTKATKALPQASSKQKNNLAEKPKTTVQEENKDKKQKNKDKKVQQKAKNNSISKQIQQTLPSEKIKSINDKETLKASVSPKKESKSKPKNKSPKNKNQRISNEQKKQQRKQTSKQARNKKQNKNKNDKKQIDIQNESGQFKSKEKQLKPYNKINKKPKDNTKMNLAIPEKPKERISKHQDDELTNTTKKKIGSRKKMPSESIQKELRQSARRSIVGKRVLFSAFVPKMRRKYFLIVQDYNEEFDYLIMKEYTRTFKALVAIAKGIPIVKNTWIEDSQQCQRIMNPNHYRFGKLQYVYEAIEKVNSGQQVFKGYQIYLLSADYHMKAEQIQILVKLGGGEIKVLKGQTKVKDTRKSIAILRNRQENDSILPQLKEQIQRAKKQGFQLVYTIEFLLEACEKQQLDWQNNKLT